MTEEEAYTKWCPMFRTNETATNRAITKSSFCIASDCMMWRREKDLYADDYGKDIPENEGFCGLGGKP